MDGTLLSKNSRTFEARGFLSLTLPWISLSIYTQEIVNDVMVSSRLMPGREKGKKGRDDISDLRELADIAS
jgi:hypothetical protein